jgi:hypothetical protein
MKPLIFILALYLEPVGAITEEPWDYIQGIEEIDVIPLEDLERKLKQKNLRIMEVTPDANR